MGTKILNNKFLLLFFLCIFIIHSNITYSEVVIEKLDQIVNWDNQEFYKDALTNLEIAKQIKQESKIEIRKLLHQYLQLILKMMDMIMKRNLL